MSNLIPVRRFAVLGGALLIVVAVSVSVSADSFRLLKPTRSDSLSYSDQYIAISFQMRPGSVWGIGYEGIGFTITNLSTQAISVDWDRTSMTLPSGQTSNVIREGTRFMLSGTSTPPTTIPPGGKLSSSVIPSGNVYYSDGWHVRTMGITSGSQFGLYLALDGVGISSTYSFIFEAVEVKPPDLGAPILAILLILALVGGLLALALALAI